MDSSFNLSVSQFPTCKVEMPINSGSQGGLLCRFHSLAHMEPSDWWIAPGSGLLLLSLFLSWGGGRGDGNTSDEGSGVGWKSRT